jgi:hypothetical protein
MMVVKPRDTTHELSHLDIIFKSVFTDNIYFTLDVREYHIK